MINFDNIANDLGRVQSMIMILFVNVVGQLVNTTGNQVLIFCTYLGSAVYIWLKIKREFFTNINKK